MKIDTNGQAVTFASSLMSGVAGSLAVTGAGSLTLNANNSYSGSTTVGTGTATVGTGTLVIGGSPTGAGR